MKWMGKVTGGLLGALAIGPIGAALGVLLGHQFDEDSAAAPEALPEEDLRAISERFFRATFHVMGYLAKADGRVSEPEIAAARAVMAELRSAVRARSTSGTAARGLAKSGGLPCEFGWQRVGLGGARARVYSRP